MRGVTVGSFIWRNGAVTLPIRGVGFQPRFIFFWSSFPDLATSEYSSTPPYTMFGFAGVDDQGEIQNVGVSLHSYTATATPSESAHSLGRLMGRHGLASPALAPKVISMDADGFTIDNDTAYNFNSRMVSYMAIYGSSSTYCKVKRWATNTASGNQSVNAGTAAAPAMVVHLSAAGNQATDEGGLDTGSAESGFSIGMMTTAAQWAASIGMGLSGGTTTVTNRRQSTSHAIAVNDGLTDVVDALATYVSMDTTGFTVNFATAPSRAVDMISICLVGASITWKLGTFNKSTTAAPTTQAVAGIGAAPDGVMFVNTSQVTSGTVNAHARLCIGAGDGVNDACMGYSEQDALVGSSKRGNRFHTNQSLMVADNDTDGHEALGYISTLDATGWTLAINVNTAVATEILYMAVTSPLTTVANVATGGGTGQVVTVSATNAVIAQPTAPTPGLYSPAIGQLWIDTSEDPPILRIGTGNQYERIFTNYMSLLATAGGQTSDVLSTIRALATWALDEDVDPYSALVISGAVVGAGDVGELYLRINSDPDNIFPIDWSGSSRLTTEVFIYIPPAIFAGSPVALAHASSGATWDETVASSMAASLALNAGKINNIQLLGRPAATTGSRLTSGVMSLFELDRNWYDYVPG